MAELDDDGVHLRFAKELHRLKAEPKALVILTCSFVELMVRTVAKARCKNPDRILKNGDYSLSVVCVLLNEASLMSNDSLRNIDRLRKIRNDAAHETFAVPQVNDFHGIPVYTADADLHKICVAITQTFWKEHQPTFYAAKFWPQSVYELEEGVITIHREAKDAGWPEEKVKDWEWKWPGVNPANGDSRPTRVDH